MSAGCITLIVIETKLDAFAALSHLVFHRVQSPVSLNVHFVKTHTHFIEASGMDGFHGAWLHFWRGKSWGLHSVQLCANTGREALHRVVTTSAEG